MYICIWWWHIYLFPRMYAHGIRNKIRDKCVPMSVSCTGGIREIPFKCFAGGANKFSIWRRQSICDGKFPIFGFVMCDDELKQRACPNTRKNNLNTIVKFQSFLNLPFIMCVDVCAWKFYAFTSTIHDRDERIILDQINSIYNLMCCLNIGNIKNQNTHIYKIYCIVYRQCVSRVYIDLPKVPKII